MTELEEKIKAYEEGIRLLTELRSEEARAEELRNALNEPNADIKQVRNEIKDLKKKIRECNKNLRALGLEGNVKLVGDLTKRLNQLRMEQAKANMQARAKLFGQKLGDLKKDLDERRKKYAEEHKGEILEKAKSIVERIRSGARELGKRSDGQRSDNENSKKKTDKVNLKALLLALTMVGATGGATGALVGKVVKAPQNNAIVEELEENESRLQEKHYVVNHQAVYKAHNVDNEYGFINFRSQPTIGSNVITQLNAGQAVFIKSTPVADTENEEATNNWKAAMFYDEANGRYVDGYVDADLLSSAPTNDAAVIIKNEDVQEVSQDDEILESEEYFEVNRFKVNAPALNFRADPEIVEGNVISKLEEGNNVFLYKDDTQTEAVASESADMSHDWKKAMYYDDAEGIYVGGYLDAQYVEETEVETMETTETQESEKTSNSEEIVEPTEPSSEEINTENTTEPSSEEINTENTTETETEVLEESKETNEQPETEVLEENQETNEAPKTSGGSIDVDSYDKSDIDAFDKYPGYREYLEKLKEKHPNWTFEPYEVNFDFNDCVNAEYNAHAVAIEDGAWSKPWYAPEWVLIDGSSWILPSKDAVACMMDTRNFINEDQIFQFESMAFSENQSVDVIKAMLKEVPWANAEKFTYTTTTGEKVTMDESFADIIYKAAKEHGVSATYLASKIIMEQGAGDTASNTAKGTVEGYLGLYNYGNINSYGFGEQIWKSGLESARENGWTTPEISVNALAEFLRENYMNRGQDIVYRTKYNFDTNGNPCHQYMTNFSGAYSEAQKKADKYRSENLMNEPYNFVIPVYKNMPETLCQMPDDSKWLDVSKINGGIVNRSLENNDAEHEVVIASVSPIMDNNVSEIINLEETDNQEINDNTDDNKETASEEEELDR